MKRLIDGSEVPARGYYYLLDFNEKNEWKLIDNLYGSKKISELTIEEYKRLFEIATSREFDNVEHNA